MMDPLTGAVLNPPEIWQMVDDLLVAGRSGCRSTRRPSRRRKNAARAGSAFRQRSLPARPVLHTKSVAEMSKDRATATRLAAASEKAGKDK